MWPCPSTTSTNLQPSCPTLAPLGSFWTSSSRAQVSWGQTVDVHQLHGQKVLLLLETVLPASVCYGSWFDHVKGWTSGMDLRSNLLQMTYEEMSQVQQIHLHQQSFLLQF